MKYFTMTDKKLYLSSFKWTKANGSVTLSYNIVCLYAYLLCSSYTDDCGICMWLSSRTFVELHFKRDLIL